MFYLKSILIAFIISAFTLYGFYNYVPVEGVRPLMTSNQDMLGASITTILGSDTLKASRSVINTNFDNLNSDKIETSTTTLPLLTGIGTIISGTWNSDIIDVAYGGTGSSTLAFGQILLGSGTNALGIVSGFGTSGQFLTSNGSGLAPNWQTSAVSLSDNYAWTGDHSFATTTALATTTQFGVAGGMMPTGSITAYATSTPPAGWLAADGSSLAVASYADLFAVIGYYYGGAGANFSLPNLNGRNIIGFGSATSTIDTMGETGGEDEHLLADTESGLPVHDHDALSSGGPGDSNAGTNTYWAGEESSSSGDLWDATTDTINTVAIADSPVEDAASAHNILDPFIVLRYIIKY